MVPPKRPLDTITDAELEAVKHLTFADARARLGIGGGDTLKRLYIQRGIDYVKRRPGQMADYNTRQPYQRGKNGRSKNQGVIGLFGDGQRVAMIWETMDEGMAQMLGLSYACPELGTMDCLDCAHGPARPDECDYWCHRCEHEESCPCSRQGWEGRR